jgi:hypothetical protein
MSDRFDEAIDRAVREMLDVEPPANLRARVMDRIDRPAHVASTFRWKSWVLAPIAAAAVLVLAVWGPWRQAPIVMVPAAPPSIAKAEPAADVFLSQPSGEAARTNPITPPRGEPSRIARTAPVRADRTIAAAIAADGPPVDGFPRVPALSVTELVVPPIRTASATRPTELSVDPIAVPAPIEIEPLSMSPRERQFQE